MFFYIHPYAERCTRQKKQTSSRFHGTACLLLSTTELPKHQRLSSTTPTVLLNHVHEPLPFSFLCLTWKGQCCALMGPSGSGKTTLLNALARPPMKSWTTQGEVLVNGHSISRSTFKKISCFVQNNEPFIGALTASETLHFAARLAGPRYGIHYFTEKETDF